MRLITRFLPCLLLLVVSHAYSSEIAEDVSGDLSNEKSNNPEEIQILKWGQDFIDGQQAFLSESVVDFSERIDNFFTDDRKAEETSKTRITVAVSQFVFREKDPLFVTDVDAKIHLPKTEGKLRLEMYSGDSSGDQTEVTQGQKNLTDSVDQNGFNFGIGYFLKAKDLINIRLRSGINIKNNQINPFVDIRSRNSFSLTEYWKFHITETLFWENVIGSGLKSVFEFERPVSEAMHFRASTDAVYYKDSQLLNLQQNLFLFHSLDDKAALIYLIGAQGDDSSGHSRANSWYINARYRKQIYKDWMFMELMPQLRYPREDDFKQETAFMFQLAMLFGAKK